MTPTELVDQARSITTAYGSIEFAITVLDIVSSAASPYHPKTPQTQYDIYIATRHLHALLTAIEANPERFSESLSHHT